MLCYAFDILFNNFITIQGAKLDLKDIANLLLH